MPRNIALALILGVAGFAAAFAVDAGLTRSWPDWLRQIWAFGLVGAVLAAVLLAVVGSGIISDQSLAIRYSGENRTLRTGHFISIYVGSLTLGVGLAIWLESAYDLRGDSVILMFCGVVFLMAAFKQPWWLYATIRRLGWFAVIESEAVMRALLGIIGLAAVMFGFRGIGV